MGPSWNLHQLFVFSKSFLLPPPLWSPLRWPIRSLTFRPPILPGRENGWDWVERPGGLDMLPSGKHTKNYGKSQFLMGKSTINVPFSIAMLVYQRLVYFWVF
jgi:hypothetical protein